VPPEKGLENKLTSQLLSCQLPSQRFAGIL
jgi:hypothetical protein